MRCVGVLTNDLGWIAGSPNDVIVMKNGDRITCEIKGLSAGILSVKLSYLDGTVAVQWSQIAHLESNRLFHVQTESGAVYTGKLSTTGATDNPHIGIQVAAAPKREVEVAQRQIVKLSQTSEGFWHRFDGAINTGILYSKGNESIQYNLSSQVAYHGESWPLGEGQVGGDDDGGLFGSLCDHLEEQLGGDFGQRDIAELIDDDRLHAGPAGQHAAQTLLPLRFDELVNQRRGGRKAHSPALTTGGCSFENYLA